MLISIGLTLVIATSGIDISVGAVVAISGALVAMLIGGTLVLKGGVQEYVTLVPMPVAIAGRAAGGGRWPGSGTACWCPGSGCSPSSPP